MKKALIIHVGNKYGRSVKSIDKIEPDLVYFIYTENYKELIEKIIDESKISYEKRLCLINNFQSIKESYEKSRKIFKELDEEYEIHVGISNGTNAMVAGLSLASVGYDSVFSYVGSVEGGRENGEVKPGFEKVFDEFHPMKQLATIEINRAKRYFNTYQFDESRRYFEKARDYLEDTRKMDMYIRIVNLYQTWDKFDNMISYEGRNRKSSTPINYYLNAQIKKEIDNDKDLKKYFYESESDFMENLEKNIEFLDKKVSKHGHIGENDIYYYLPDLLNNAYRRIEENKFDDATARLYRTAELIAQIRLYEKGLIEKKRLEKKKIFHIEKENIVRNYPINVVEYIRRHHDFQNPYRDTVRLGLSEDYEVLKILGDKLAIKFLDDKHISRGLYDRNDTILAHGFSPSKKENTLDLYNNLIGYANQTVDNLDKCIEYSKFPKFKDIND